VPDPGDMVTVDFVGATGVTRRPAVVVSSALYHAHRPDLVLAVLTTQVATATAPTDYILQDWSAAGLYHPSAFRAY
jgi:mRNA interferase MazF